MDHADIWSEVDNYLSDLLIGPDPELDAALRRSESAGLPEIQVSPPLGRMLHMLARLAGARKILELGTLGGYSTIWLARALPKDGRLVSLELEPDYAKVAAANIAEAGLSSKVDLRVGRATDSLQRLVEEKAGPFDLIFIDADKESYPEYLPWSLKLSRPGTVIVADNVVRNGAVVEESSDDPRVQGVRAFLDLVAAEPRLTATALQTVGSKGYDGFLLARVNG